MKKIQIMIESYMMKVNGAATSSFLAATLFLPGSLLAGNAPAESPPNSVVMQEGSLQVTQEDVERLFADMSPGQRVRTLANPDGVSELIVDLLVLKKQSAAAEKKHLAADDQVAWKLELERKRVLADALLKHWKSDYAAQHDVTLLAEEYYQSHPSEFIEPEQLRAAHILLRVAEDGSNEVEQLSKAEDLLAKLKSGLDFADAAKKFSNDSSAKRGGELGWFSRGRMVKPFEDAAFALATVGGLSDVVRSNFGYHIIKLLERKQERKKPFEEVRNALIKERLAKLQEKELRAFLAGFEPTGDAVLYVPVLEGIVVKLKDSMGKGK